MLNAIKQLRDREDEGFTLIELMVVVLIIAILLAIAIPTFLGARNTANARGAQSDLRNALTAEQTQWTNGQAFSSTTTQMAGVESALTWSTAAPVAGNTVSVAVMDPDSATNPQQVILEAYGKDGNCWFINQSNDPQASFTSYGVSPQSSTHTCPAITALTTVPPTAPTAGSAANNPGTAGAQPTVFYTSF